MNTPAGKQYGFLPSQIEKLCKLHHPIVVGNAFPIDEIITVSKVNISSSHCLPSQRLCHHLQ
jgi:hypothetical protein